MIHHVRGSEVFHQKCDLKAKSIISLINVGFYSGAFTCYSFPFSLCTSIYFTYIETILFTRMGGEGNRFLCPLVYDLSSRYEGQS